MQILYIMYIAMSAILAHPSTLSRGSGLQARSAQTESSAENEALRTAWTTAWAHAGEFFRQELPKAERRISS